MKSESEKIKEILDWVIFNIKPNVDELKYIEEQKSKYYYYNRIDLLFPSKETHNEAVEQMYRHKVMCNNLSKNIFEFNELYQNTNASEVFEFLAFQKARKYL